ncbi:unnamed protein product [Didymodactylos carnosus]|uniref:Uncharacterized protein n=1 Tax=Didymodactylos carnosus TaxID=1234261 RepID=A0A814VLP2_9BILA|nr:unnamed protein product [Didymodactylos carnosus]CAF1192633.1 unnamed protein product [Didymodactylos carnosus]CAF3840797.1 unnamed protein product [Didymodactylos carnosus]CAF3956878.1 unnamed protein product [Didymodactylos carnosus]
MPSICEKPRIPYIHTNFDIQQYTTQYELQSERKCLFFLNVINPYKDEYGTNDSLHQTIVNILLKHLKMTIKDQYNAWPMYNVACSSLTLKYLYTTNELNFQYYPSDIICKEYAHLHGICWSTVKQDKSLYDKMKEYLNNFRHEIIDLLNENKMMVLMEEEFK